MATPRGETENVRQLLGMAEWLGSADDVVAHISAFLIALMSVCASFRLKLGP